MQSDLVNNLTYRMNSRESYESRRIFVVSYLQHMSSNENQLKELIRHEKIVNRVFRKFFKSDDLDNASKHSFFLFDTARKILDDPKLLLEQALIDRFLDACPGILWRRTLQFEFISYLSQRKHNLNLLNEFLEKIFVHLTLTNGYATFRQEINEKSERIIQILFETYYSSE